MIPPAVNPAILVTGTDTGVGKTVVAAALARAARAGVMKPIGCGLAEGEAEHADTRFLRENARVSDPAPEVTPVVFKAFRAPMVAARLEGRAVDLSPVWGAMERLRSRHRALVVEGVGGIRVPIREGYEVRDFVREAGLPVLLVARSGLGTMNHTALTAEALKGIPVLGFVFNDGADPVEDALAGENAEVLKAMTGLPFLGRVRPDPRVAEGGLSPATVEALRPAARLWLGAEREA